MALMFPLGFPGGSDGNKPTCNAGEPGLIPESRRSLEKGMETHSSILVWRIPWTGEPGGLPSMGSQRIGHNLSNIACTRNSYRFARGKFWLYVKQNWFEKALIKVFVFITSLLFLFGEYEPIFLKAILHFYACLSLRHV